MKRRRIIPIAIIASLILVATLSVGFLRSESDDFKLAKNLDIYYSLFRELNTFYVDGIDADKLVTTSITQMLRTLDPYTVYYSESDFEDFRFMTTGIYGGVGSTIRSDGEYVVLTQIYKGFPADLCGLKAGDKLVEIDGFSLKGLPADKVSEKLKGEPNTEINIIVERQGKQISKNLKRERIAIPPVPYYGMLNKDVGYIRFTNFTQNCNKDVEDALIALKEENNAQKIVLDLRNNPGGLLTEAVEIVNLFVGPGQDVVKTLGKVDKFDATYKTKHQAVDEEIPLVVIINRNTASAAEIVAGAVQDLDRGVVVGQRSYGKGLVQISRPLSYNAILKVTTAKYYIPSGRCVQALDFTHRNEDGSVGHVPDSLISEFKTRNGRTVRDGGGIMPDYNIENPRLSQVATELYLRSFIFDYVTDFYWRNKDILPPGEFKLSDADYNNFGVFLKEKGFSYETATENALNDLLNTSKEEKYYDVNKEIFDDLKFKLEHNLDSDLSVFKDEIVSLIEDEIIVRYFYEEGMIKHTIGEDQYIDKSIEILGNKELYSLTLKGNAGLLSAEPVTLLNNSITENNEPGISC